LIIPTLTEATNFSAVNDSGASLSVTTEPASVPIAKRVEVRFASNLFYNHTAVVHLQYDLPSGAPRGKSLTRVTAAFSTFVAWALGDPGAADVSIVVPKSFEVDVVGDSTTMETGADTVTYSATAIADPYKWGVAVSARNDKNLLNGSVKVDGHSIGVRSFPDDPKWGTFANDEIAKGLPALEELIGLPWPGGDDLVVTETVTPYLYGYGGWYRRGDNTIEIGDALDPRVIVHEMSHVWLNDLLFDERWIDEGLAQEYAARAIAKSGGKLESPKGINTRDAGVVRLQEWPQVNLQDEISRARETYGYNASWFVVRRLTTEIGMTGMRRVIVAASSEAMPYLGSKNPQAAAGAGTWKRFLDYLDETGGSKAADALFATYVAPKSDTALAERKQARAAYAQFVARSGGWTPPLVIRQAMTDWNFGFAGRQIDRAKSVTTVRDAIEKTVRPLGLHTPASLKQAYQDEATELSLVRKTANDELSAATELVSASDAVNGQHGLFTKIGLIGAKHHADLSRAQQSFETGNGAASRESALAAEKVVTDASSEGTKRVGFVFGPIVLIVLLAFGGRKWRRRRAKKAATIEADPAPVLDPDDAPEQEPQNEEVTTWPAG
jgi:hypothetical protein